MKEIEALKYYKKVRFFLHFFVVSIIINCLYFVIIIMKKILYSFLSIFILFSTISPICFAQEEDKDVDSSADEFSQWQVVSRQLLTPTSMVDSIYWNANWNKSNQVQYTEYDVITSRVDLCATGRDGRFTITRTLCNLRELSKDYLQYVMYIWLTAATILLIRNWFKIVTSTDREKEISNFKNNLKYIVIWVFLLIWFYYIINLFVAIVNLITGSNTGGI